MRKLKHVPGLIPDYVELIRNNGAVFDDAGVLTDIARFVRFPDVDHNVYTCMYGDSGSRISITDTTIVMETVYQYQHGADPETEISTSPWQAGVYSYSKGDAHLYSTRRFPRAFSELQGIEISSQAPIVVARTRHEMKDAIMATWRLCYIPRTGESDPDHKLIQLVGSKDPHFSQQYDVYWALRNLAFEMEERMVGFKPIDLKNPIADYHWPAEGTEGYLPAKLLDLIEQYNRVLEWVRATKNEKQGRLLLLMIDGDINTELQKLRTVTDKKVKDISCSPLRVLIDEALKIKRKAFKEANIPIPTECWPHHIPGIAKHFEVTLGGFVGAGHSSATSLLCKELFERGLLGVSPMIFTASRLWEAENPHTSSFVSFEKLMEPGYSLTLVKSQLNASVLVAYLPLTAEEREKTLRRLRHLVLKWMVDTGEVKNLVLLT
jgi:hypothetical protein